MAGASPGPTSGIFRYGRENANLFTFFPSLAGGVYTPIQVSGASNTFPEGINNNGEVVGFYLLSSNSHVGYGFTLSSGTYTTDIVVPGAISTCLTGINDSGELAGFYCAPASGTNCLENSVGALGFVGSNGAYSTVTIPGFTSVFVYTISNAGVIAGEVDTNYVAADDIREGFIDVPK